MNLPTLGHISTLLVSRGIADVDHDANVAVCEEPDERETPETYRQTSLAQKAEVHRSVSAFSAKNELGTEKATGLNMDHVYLSLWDFLWCAWFVFPPMILNILFGGPCSSGLAGIVVARLRQKFGIYGQITEVEAEGVLVDWVTSNSMIMWTTRIEDTPDMVQLWITIPDATHIRTDSHVETGNLSAHLDVTNRRVVECTFRGKSVGKHDALVLWAIAGAGITHPLIHAFANWGINPEASNSFIRRMAIITIKYNNVGVRGVPRLFELLRWAGLVKYINRDVTRLATHVGYVPPSHHLLRSLQKHFPFVAFMVKVRHYFLSQFKKYQSDFDFIDGEALFLGTVMHSIDHRQATHYIKIKHLQSDDPAFDADHEFAMFTLNCMTDKPPGRLFEARFSHAPHKLFRDTYEFAVQLDRRLAGYMEACIAA